MKAAYKGCGSDDKKGAKYIEKISYCYGKNKINGIPFKTGIENDNSVDESVASWMKKNLRK